MIIALIATFILFLTVFLLAIPVRQISFKFGKDYPFTINLVLALAIYLIFFGWTAYLNLRINKYFYIVFLILLFSYTITFNRSFFRQVRSKINKDLITAAAFLLFIIGDFLLILNGSLKAQRFTFRNGPDLFGWTTSSQLFCEGKTISDLTSSVMNQANYSQISNLFKLNPGASAEHIYRIPSLTDQINAEFILGSKRFAIQNYLGSWCEINNSVNILTIIVAFIILNSALQFALIRRLSIIYGATNLQSSVVASLSVLGLNVMSPLIEGGLGQYLSCTFLLAIWLLLECGAPSPKSVALPILIGGLSLSYFDGVIFAVVFISVFSLIYFKKNFLVGKIIRTFQICFFICVFSLVVSFPISKDMIKLLLDRVSGHRGGWNQGRLPLPADLLGISNWLPADSLSTTTITWVAILGNLLLLFIVLQFKFLIKIESKFSSLLLTFLLIYFYFLIDVYVRNSSEINNYNLLKYGMYLIGCNAVLLLILTGTFKRISYSVKSAKGNNLFEFRLIRIVISFLLASFVASTMNFQYQYIQNRKYTLDIESNSEARNWFLKYDILVYGFSNPGAPQLAILGDLHYGAATRGFGLSTKFSVPKRELVGITPKNYCNKYSCEFSSANKKYAFKPIGETRDLTLYEFQELKS